MNAQNAARLSAAATSRAAHAAVRRAGVSILDLAYATGIAYSTLYRKLTGKASLTVADVAAIAAHIGVEPETITVYRGK